MPPRQAALERPGVRASRIVELPETSLLDVLDRLLNKGVVADGDLSLGVAGVDLIYVRLAALLCAADRVLPPHVESTGRQPRRVRHRLARRRTRPRRRR